MIWLSWSWGRYMEQKNAYLSDEARVTLSGYAVSAEQAWNVAAMPVLMRGCRRWANRKARGSAK